MISVITDVEGKLFYFLIIKIKKQTNIYIYIYFFTDEETGGYVSYQCVLPMHVHGSGYVQMQMISNSKAEKLVLHLKLR